MRNKSPLKLLVYSAVLMLVAFAGYAAYTSLKDAPTKKAARTWTFQEGDIVFQESESLQCTAVKKATKSRYSHCGIILRNNGELQVFEAIQPVCFTPIEEWIERGKNAHVVLKRLSAYKNGLDSAALVKMHTMAQNFNGMDYDIYFDWSDSRIYCSELVWKLYKRAMNLEVGHLQRLKDFDLSSPEARQLMRARYGKNIPYNEEVIPPSGIYDCELLYEVGRR